MNAAVKTAAALLGGLAFFAAHAQEGAAMNIVVKSDAHEVVCTLNSSRAAQSLLAQLPLTLDISDYARQEKTFSPPRKLDTSGAQPDDGSRGTLAYFAPWNTVVLFYKDSGPYSWRYGLGTCTQGADAIEKLRGRVSISVQP